MRTEFYYMNGDTTLADGTSRAVSPAPGAEERFRHGAPSPAKRSLGYTPPLKDSRFSQQESCFPVKCENTPASVPVRPPRSCPGGCGSGSTVEARNILAASPTGQSGPGCYHAGPPGAGHQPLLQGPV